MFRNPLQDGFQPSGIRRFRRNLLFSMQNEQSQKTQQSALDDQFIAWKFGAVGIFDFLQTVRRLRIIQIIRRQMYVQCQTPALQRKNILFGTQISCTTQKFRIKNNILISPSEPLPDVDFLSQLIVSTSSNIKMHGLEDA